MLRSYIKRSSLEIGVYIEHKDIVAFPGIGKENVTFPRVGTFIEHREIVAFPRVAT